ncbi:MAG: queuosine salvage family protein [Candidatus Binataceae bacterium]
MNLFDEIRNECREVAEGAAFVSIDYARLGDYARSLGGAELAAQELDPRVHFLGHGERTLAFIVILDSISFGSGWFPHLRKRPGKSGSLTLASSLRDAFDAGEDFSAERLSRITTDDCARLFGQDPQAMPVKELLGKFAQAFNDLGRLLLERYHGSYANLVESSAESAQALVHALRQMPFFEDVQTWHGRRVPFYKRAQLTAATLALAFDHDRWGRFRDLDELTVFADNLVPHVLRVDGILLYEESLAVRIDREELIPAGSPEEIEIRACALHAVELITVALRKMGRHATAMNVDYLLFWNRGQTPAYKSARPRHRTRTVFY